MLQSLESFIFHALIIPLDWVGLVTRISDPKEYHNQYHLNSTIQLMIYKICEFLNELDYELVKLLSLAILCPPVAIFWKFGCCFKLVLSILGIMLGLTPIVIIYTIYCIRSQELNEYIDDQQQL